MGMPRVTCPLITDTTGVCSRVECARPLIGRQRKWCSQECNDWFWANHLWSWARETARKRDNRHCVRCSTGGAIEVNHIDPRRGKGYGTGCWNHQDNLETLCSVHHQEETNRQRRGLPSWREDPSSQLALDTGEVNA